MTIFLILLYVIVGVSLVTQVYVDVKRSAEGWSTVNRLGILACLIWPPILLIVSLLTLALHAFPALQAWSLETEK